MADQYYLNNGTWLEYSNSLFYFYSSCGDSPIVLKIKEMKKLVESITKMQKRAAIMQKVLGKKKDTDGEDNLRYLYGKIIAVSRLNTVVKFMMGRMGQTVVIFLQEFYMSHKTPTELKPGSIIDIDSDQSWYDLDKFAREACGAHFDDYE